MMLHPIFSFDFHSIQTQWLPHCPAILQSEISLNFQLSYLELFHCSCTNDWWSNSRFLHEPAKRYLSWRSCGFLGNFLDNFNRFPSYLVVMETIIGVFPTNFLSPSNSVTRIWLWFFWYFTSQPEEGKLVSFLVGGLTIHLLAGSMAKQQGYFFGKLE